MQACIRNYTKRPLAFLNPLKPPSGHVHIQPKRSISTSTVNAASSIRSAIAHGHVDYGYQLFTKSYTSVHQEAKSSLNLVGIRPKPRYLAHVLLHALHRARKPLNAAKLAELCMQRGIKIHEHTFSIVFAGVSPPCDVSVPVRRPTHPQKLPPMSSITAAVGLLRAARGSGHRRHSWMYDRVINALLLQGEVLTATLLFIALVKEWNARCLENAVHDDALVSDDNTRPRPTVKHRRINPPIPVPQDIWLQNICTAIERDAERSIDGAKIFPAPTLRALLALVGIFEDRQCIPGRSSLLHTLRVTLLVQDLNDAAREKFHSTLLGICQQPRETTGLDLFSYHTLLHYAIQDRKSMDLGANVIQALCGSHNPTSATYNILLRNLALLGEDSAVEAVTRVLGTRHHFALGPLPPKDIPLTLKEDAQRRIVFSLSSRPVPLPAECTAVAGMSEAIERGDLEAACEFVTQLFPALAYSRLQSRDCYGGRGAVVRASKLSSYFWTKAQHAAAKAGQLRLSMCIWRLVTRAELIQYHPAAGNKVPHLYSVEAYNSLLHLFLSNLQRVEQEAEADGQEAEQEKYLSIQYHRLLGFIQRVIVSLRDRTIENTMIAGFKFDDGLAQVLFAIVELILRLEQRLPPPDYGVVVTLKRDPSEWHDVQCRPRRILGVVRKIMYHYGIPHPESLQQLGFGHYSNKAPLLQPDSSSPVTLLTAHKRKQPAFRVLYPGNTSGLRARDNPKVRGKPGSDPLAARKTTNRLVEILHGAKSVSAKPPA